MKLNKKEAGVGLYFLKKNIEKHFYGELTAPPFFDLSFQVKNRMRDEKRRKRMIPIIRSGSVSAMEDLAIR